MKIVYYIEGEKIIIDCETLEEVIEKIEDNTIYLNKGKVDKDGVLYFE